MQIWLTILVSWPAPTPPISPTIFAYDSITAGPPRTRLFAADHHAELPVLRAGLPAGHRGVQETDFALSRGNVEFARDCRRRRGVIDEGRAVTCPRGRLPRLEHGAQIIIVADTREHENGAMAASRGVGADAPPLSRTQCSARAAVRFVNR
jgi:hypothetical protein